MRCFMTFEGRESFMEIVVILYFSDVLTSVRTDLMRELLPEPAGPEIRTGDPTCMSVRRRKEAGNVKCVGTKIRSGVS